MVRIVQKFGGTSVGDIQKIQNVARIIADSYVQDKEIVVVVSAMAGVTNQLSSYCYEISNLNLEGQAAEYDVALSSGEILTASLLALSLQNLGIPASSILGWQLPIITNDQHKSSLIETIETESLENLISSRIIPVIAGFQGVNKTGRVTTLGRGGSDTSAAAIAAVLKAHELQIYTDVAGVFSADPRLVSKAKQIQKLSYEEMVEFAATGAKVLHQRSVQIAMKYNIPIKVISTFENNTGTMISKNERSVEEKSITGITHNQNIARVRLQLADQGLDQVLAMLESRKIQIMSLDNQRDNEFFVTIDINELGLLESGLEQLAIEYISQTDLALVTIIGQGLRYDAKLFSQVIMAANKINTSLISAINNDNKISLMISENEAENLVKLLHNEFIG